MLRSNNLHMGWLLDVVGHPPAKVNVCLEGSGLKAHSLFVAQSGSGKSVSLGRLIEELAMKTRASIVILDPNSDFTKLDQVNVDAWTNKDYQNWWDENETAEKFSELWSKVRFKCLRKMSADEISTMTTQTTFPISISWNKLPLETQADLLGFKSLENPSENRLLHLIDSIGRSAELQAQTGNAAFPLDDFIGCAEVFLSFLAGGKIPVQEKFGNLFKYVKEPGVPVSAAVNVLNRLRELKNLGILDLGVKTIQDHCTEISNPSVLVMDLPSLETTEAIGCVSGIVLNSIWKFALERWLDAIKNPIDQDRRAPVFIVIDEAHNLAPESQTSTGTNVVIDLLTKIATEGRKFGLFLILATQRPSRLNATLLSQCDNICLMKMNNRHDLDLVEKSFGFIPRGWVKRAVNFAPGDCLFSGFWVERPVYAHIAPRRTIEGGRNLKDSWLQK